LDQWRHHDCHWRGVHCPGRTRLQPPGPGGRMRRPNEPPLVAPSDRRGPVTLGRRQSAVVPPRGPGPLS
jgi:hypothetical protein